MNDPPGESRRKLWVARSEDEGATFVAERTALDLSELILDLREMLGVDVDIVETQRVSQSIALLERGAVPL